MNAIAAPHLAQYRKNYSTAQQLEVNNDEWAVVCYFYAAFRAVRAAFYADQRLNSDSAARSVSTKLNAGSRHVDFHNGHPLRGPGVNDVVLLLYPSIGARYEQLHVWSCEVRYDQGLTVGTIADARAHADTIIGELSSRGLI